MKKDSIRKVVKSEYVDEIYNEIKKTYTNQRTYKSKQGYEDYSGEVSIVTPDQAYTVQQIFDKFRQGVKLPLERDVYYSDTDDFDHPDGYEMLDITDFHEVKDRIQSENADLRAQAAKTKADKAKALELAEEQRAKADFEKADKPL